MVLREALAATRCTRRVDGPTDFRTAILFFGANGERLKSVYYGLDPKVGAIDQNDCELSGNLYSWARKQLPSE
jgi:hypothetical protein